MRPAEIVWRARSAASLPVDWIQFKTGGTVAAPHYEPFTTAAYPIRRHGSGSAMEHIDIFDCHFPVDFDFDWNKDYRNNKEVERRFSRCLDIRNIDVVGDVKYVWEVNRHQYLSSLAYARNGSQHTETFARAIRSWLSKNPYLTGVNWTSSMELALRMISWALLYPRLAEDVDSDGAFWDHWHASIYLHLSRIAHRLSLHSSANNHLIGELVGLYVGASCFPFWDERASWRDLAHTSLEREILLQVSDDGVNKEQAMSYHLFTLELLLLAFVIGRNCGRPFGNSYATRLRAMLHYLDVVATAAGDLPWYGDSDDARGFLFSQNESALEVTTQLGGLLFDEPAWLRFRTMPTAAAEALIPDLLGGLTVQSPHSDPVCELFKDGGLASVRSDTGAIRLLMDFGSLGYTSIAAHGHADALAIWMAIGDAYFLIDAGTYAYHSHPEWRTYFRSTTAHNTACIDDCNQSQIAGRFLWNSKAKSRLVRFQESTDRVIIEAEHDGYTRLDDPVVHRRCVDFDRATGNFNLADSFYCADQHKVEICFHLHEDAIVTNIADRSVDVFWHGSRVAFSSPDASATWDVNRGSETPKLGWRSRTFNLKHPIPTLRLSAEIDGNTVIATHVDVQP
jgi:hypothetical protein